MGKEGRREQEEGTEVEGEGGEKGGRGKGEN